MAREHIAVLPADAGERLDRFLRRQALPASRAALAELIAEGHVRVNGRRASKGLVLRAGDQVELEPEALVQGPAPDPELPLRVLYEDAWLVAIDKPAGVPSHALRAGETGNAASGLLARYPELAGVGHRPLEPGLLPGLDTDTSGVLLAARTREAFAVLHAQHAAGQLEKEYLALCAGPPPAPRQLDAFLDASARRVRVEPEPFGHARPIRTQILGAEAVGPWSLLRVSAAFAARHQVRAQLAAIGHPIAGDELYGGAQLAGITGHVLHASRVVLTHPQTGVRLSLLAPLPERIRDLLIQLRS